MPPPRLLALFLLCPIVLSTLQMVAVTPKTAGTYFDHLFEFGLFLQETRQTVALSSLDALAVLFMESLLADGESPNRGTYLLAAMLHAWPMIGSSIRNAFPGGQRALEGWRKVCPARTRQPLPFLGLMVILGGLLAEGNVLMALALLVGFSTYMRPRELLNLTGENLVPPCNVGSTRFRHWGLILHPQHRGEISKTGASDENLPLDSQVLAGLHEFFFRLHSIRGAAEKLWDIPYQTLSAAFRRLVLRSGMKLTDLCLYTIRHGGASHDLLFKHRTLPEIKMRGRWVTDASLVRYTKATQAQAELLKIPAAAQQFGSLVESNLVEFFNFPKRLEGP